MAVKTRNQTSPVRRVTRSTVQQGLITSCSQDISSGSPSPTKKPQKKVKFLTPGKRNQNSSLVSDEGIDMSFSPVGLQVPAAISRPQHKLQQAWTMWYSPKNQKTNWCQNQHQVCSMGTVEEFWHCYNQIKLASNLKAGSTYAVFRQGIIPDWNDPANTPGGRWMIYFERRERQSQLDGRWMEALLLTLGDHLGQSVAGIQVCIRKKFDRIEVWLGNLKEVAKIGRKLKEQLDSEAAKMEFSIHCEDKEGVKGPRLMI